MNSPDGDAFGQASPRSSRRWRGPDILGIKPPDVVRPRENAPPPPFSSGAASTHKKKDRLTAIFPNVEWGLMIR
jgi:hypothetical protein